MLQGIPSAARLVSFQIGRRTTIFSRIKRPRDCTMSGIDYGRLGWSLGVVRACVGRCHEARSRNDGLDFPDRA